MNMKIDFNLHREGSGTHEWAEVNFNIGKGCACDCRYCYARWFAMHYKRISDQVEWTCERFTDNAFKSDFKLLPGVIMFPSTHNLSPFYLQRALPILINMLAAGNKVLIVTKPDIEVIKVLVGNLVKYRNQILFRFTIGSLDETLMRFWEPGAPSPEERLSALDYAYAAGFSTSISIEPMLAGVDETLHVISAVSRHVSETIWIGKMAHIKQRVDMTPDGVADAVKLIESQQSDSEIIRLYCALADNPKIRWKKSIAGVLKRHDTPQFRVKAENDKGFQLKRLIPAIPRKLIALMGNNNG